MIGIQSTRRFASMMAVVAIATACAGPVGLVAGESLRAPEPIPPRLHVHVIAADDLSPLAADLLIGQERLTADAEGLADTLWGDQPTQLTVSAPGFHSTSTIVRDLPEVSPLEIQLDPVILAGTVTTSDGRGLPGATIASTFGTTVSGADGGFKLTRAVPGELSLTRPAWEPLNAAWSGVDQSFTVAMEPRLIRALRVGGDKAGNPSEWKQVLEFARSSGINAMVIDTKNEAGTVFHNTEVSTAHEIGAVKAFYNLDDIIADMDEIGLYKITRIVTFQDNPLARARPEIAAIDATTGETWKNRNGIRWLDPTDRESWEYALELAEEACRRGFDEIQFDYVRFPSDGDVSTLKFDEDYVEDVRVATISAFLKEAHKRLNPIGCAVAADIFAITLESDWDEGIGQRPEELSHAVDVLSPMIYTYTYSSGWRGFENPNDHPLEIVGGALNGGAHRLEGFSVYRPWIQTWPLDPSEMREVQDLAEEKVQGWMMWSANTFYRSEMLPPRDSS